MESTDLEAHADSFDGRPDRGRLSDIALLDLLRGIISSRWAAGEAIPSEPELVARFGFSKVVVREGIRALATLGFVRVQQGKRTLVLDDAGWDIHSPFVQTAYRLEGRAQELLDAIFEARLTIEPAMAALCATRATADEIASLEASVAALRAASVAADRRGYEAADAEFHALIGKASGNASLRAILADLMRYVVTLAVVDSYESSETAQMTDLHAEIAVRIALGDAEGARAACGSSVRYVHKVMRSHS